MPYVVDSALMRHFATSQKGSGSVDSSRLRDLPFHFPRIWIEWVLDKPNLGYNSCQDFQTALPCLEQTA